MKLELINYTEKSLAVIGDTYKIKTQLKELGGRFNKFLFIEGEKKAGWIFSKKVEPELTAIVKQLSKPLPEMIVNLQKGVDELKTFELLGLPKITSFGLADVYVCEYFKRQDVECLDDAIAVELNGVHVSLSSFERFGDKNKITQTIAKRYLRANGHGVDSIAELVRSYGYMCDENDIVEYIVNNPCGKPLKNEKMRLCCDLFREHYGKDLNIRIAKDMLELKSKMMAELQTVGVELPEGFEVFGNDNDNPF
jgi:hypothetical protein